MKIEAFATVDINSSTFSSQFDTFFQERKK